jgi:hypothetical protein
MKKTSILSKVKPIVRDRSRQYGGASEEFPKLGMKWAATLGLSEAIPAHLVGVMMLDLKTTRLAQGYHEDSLVDVIGYSLCIESVEINKK